MSKTKTISSTALAPSLFKEMSMALPASILSKHETFNYQSSHVDALQQIDFGSDTLRIIVGQEAHIFFVHEQLMSSRSGFIRTAVRTVTLGRNGPERPALHFTESHSETFSCYINLSYTGRISTSAPGKLGVWSKIIDLYILAEKLRDSWAKDRTIEAMYSFIEGEIKLSSGSFGLPWAISFPAPIVRLYDGTKAGNQARALFAHVYASWCTSEDFVFGNPAWPKEFWCDVIVHIIDQRPPASAHKALERPVSKFYQAHLGIDAEGKTDVIAQALVESAENMSLNATKI